MRACPQCRERFDEDVPFCPHDGTRTELVTDSKLAPAVDPLLGRVIDGRYRVEKMIGEGGMGVVYQIAHVILGKRMALKILRGDMARDPEVVQRFIQEAQSATQIGHQNIIDISDFGKLPDDNIYFVMEFLDGESLTSFIGRGGSVPAQKALHIIRQIASALDAAHERGIVHRDLKPDNIYLVKQGHDESFVKVLDFGIAKVGGASSKLTKTGMIFGTPHYMSPEQAAGQSVDRRTDIYALGVIMYEMFAGRVPFDGDTFMGILSKHMFQDPVPPSQVKGAALGAIEDIILRSLTKKAETRYQTMGELIADLDRVNAGGAISIGRGGIAPPGNLADVLELPSRTEMRMGQAAPPARSKWPIVLGVAAFATVGILGVGGAWWVGMRNPSPNPSVSIRPGTLDQVGATSQAGMPPGSASAGATTPVTIGSGTIAPEVVVPPGGAGEVPTPAEVPSPVAAPSAVRIDSDPPGADVLIEGALIGQTPLDVPRPSAGERAIVIRQRGFVDARVLVLPTTASGVAVTLERVRRGTTMDSMQPSLDQPPQDEPMQATTQTMMVQHTTDVVDPWE